MNYRLYLLTLNRQGRIYFGLNSKGEIVSLPKYSAAHTYPIAQWAAALPRAGLGKPAEFFFEADDGTPISASLLGFQ